LENDPDLMAFNTWRAVQPDAERSGVAFAANDHAAKSCPVWWAEPETGFFDRMRAEARARGIIVRVIRAPYSRQQLRRAIDLIFGGSERLRQLGFDLQAIAGPTPEFFGLTVRGAVLGDETAEQLPAPLVASVRDELDALLQGSQARLDDVRIEYGKVAGLIHRLG
jgi:hypothetical protein